MRKIKLIGLSVLVLAFCSYLIRGFNILENAQEDTFVSFPKITDTYHEIFTERLKVNVKTSLTYFSKRVNPVVTLNAIDNSYQLVIFKVKSKNVSLRKILINSEEKRELETNKVYNASIKPIGYEIHKTLDSIKNFNKLYLFLEGSNLISLIKNDTLISYKLNLKTLSLSTSKFSNFILFCDKNFNNFKEDPFELVFLKKDDDIFIILKFINDNTSISNKPLYKLFLK